jgi:starch synthase (maltosyl-transferring)
MTMQKRTSARSGSKVSPVLASHTAGPRIYNLFPLLVGKVSAWRAELPRIAAMAFDWVYLNPFHETGGSRSLYAVRDPSRLDPRFRDEGAGDDDAQLREFVEEAERHGLKVMTDLVVNHTAREALLAHERPELFKRDAAGEIESPFAVDPDDPTKKTVWGDLAEFDYDNPA